MTSSTSFPTLSPACALPLIPCSAANNVVRSVFSYNTSIELLKLLSIPDGLVINPTFFPSNIVKLLSKLSIPNLTCTLLLALTVFISLA